MYDYLEPLDDSLLMRSAGPWAAIKLDYLRRYIDVFETSMREKWQVRSYIDLLAGPGKNRVRDTNEILLGSPLIALNVKHPFTSYYFNDLDVATADALRERCKASPLMNSIHILNNDCNLAVDQVVQRIRPTEQNSLNLAFLDPKGLELYWRTIAKLASIRRMDMIINYPQGGLNRAMAGAYQTSGETSVDLFFGSTEWREIYSQYKNQRKFPLQRELLDLYKSRLQSLGYKEVLRSDELGGEEPLIRNAKRGAPLYRLIFASKHPLGEKFWHSVTRRDVYGQKRLLDSR